LQRKARPALAGTPVENLPILPTNSITQQFMARVKLVITTDKIFTANIPVRISDINYGNHVGNDSFVSILHEARLQWLNSHGFTELDIEGTGLIMSDLAVEFKQEAFYGDTIEVVLSTGDITSAGFELYYQLFTNRNNQQQLLARAKTGMVCYNYQQKKVSAISEKFKAILTAGNH
jgi:acyl-CoA thioester hydrolase